ncbi:MAG: hypothetical protein AB1861_03380 [Cyanobacteriota bacterium]
MNKGRGSNPNSHSNKENLGVKGGDVSLTPQQWELAFQIGKGNRSKGIRKLIDLAAELHRLGAVRDVAEVDKVAIAAFQSLSRTYPDNLPYPQSLVLYLSARAAQGDDEAQAHLDYLESWSAEQAMDEILGEGAIAFPGGWIA